MVRQISEKYPVCTKERPMFVFGIYRTFIYTTFICPIWDPDKLYRSRTKKKKTKEGKIKKGPEESRIYRTTGYYNGNNAYFYDNIFLIKSKQCICNSYYCPSPDLRAKLLLYIEP